MAKLHSTVSGLRTRFSPKSRVGQGLVSLAPWFDGVVLLLLFILVESKFVLTPGVLVDLPQAPIRAGAQHGVSAVVLSVESATAEGREEIVFVEDEPFHLASEEDRIRLSVVFARLGASSESPLTLLLFADESIAHGTIVRLCDIARSQGITHVNVATRSPQEVPQGW